MGWGGFKSPCRDQRKSSSMPSATSTGRRAGATCWRSTIFRSRSRDREFVALLGPSGCGKSTLLYLIGGFLPIETGAIRVDGKPVDGPGPDRGIVFQHFALFPWKTVRGNMLYGLERQGLREGRAREARAGFHRARGPARLRGQLPLAALRRHEAAHGDRAHARLRSEDPADGRALRRARRADARADAIRTASASGSARRRR